MRSIPAALIGTTAGIIFIELGKRLSDLHPDKILDFDDKAKVAEWMATFTFSTLLIWVVLSYICLLFS